MVVYWSVPYFTRETYFNESNNFNLVAQKYSNKYPCYLDILEPQPLSSELFEYSKQDMKPANNFFMCPSYHSFLKNKFVIKSPLDYDLTWNVNNEMNFFSSSFYDQKFFDNYVSTRESSFGMVSLLFFSHIFFAEESCDMEVTSAYLSNNDFVNDTIYIPGTMNIGDWFRNLDFAFLMKYKNKPLKINQGDSLRYVNFKTDQKITFKKFFFTEKCSEILNYCLNQKLFKKNKNVKSYLQDIYGLFKQSKLKNVLLKEIKSNLME